MAQPNIDEEDLTTNATCCASFTTPVEVGQVGSTNAGSSAFFLWPLFGPLLFENESSDARDHCANERTFLSYLRLSIYMAIVSVAITLSFHLKTEASDLELRMAKPLGSIFWALSVMTLFAGFGNYITTVNKYSKKAAIVQTGWKTQVILSITATAIVGTCIILLIITKLKTTK